MFKIIRKPFIICFIVPSTISSNKIVSNDAQTTSPRVAETTIIRKLIYRKTKKCNTVILISYHDKMALINSATIATTSHAPSTTVTDAQIRSTMGNLNRNIHLKFNLLTYLKLSELLRRENNEVRFRFTGFIWFDNQANG